MGIPAVHGELIVSNCHMYTTALVPAGTHLSSDSDHQHTGKDNGQPKHQLKTSSRRSVHLARASHLQIAGTPSCQHTHGQAKQGGTHTQTAVMSCYHIVSSTGCHNGKA